ncbi:MAG: hypothetical protein HY828_01375 [Actinobacteria bacterium]|nr:hypothetical protein [Actinomycetota bacterium]
MTTSRKTSMSTRLRQALVRFTEEDRQHFPGRVGLHEYLLAHGRAYPSSPLTPEELDRLRCVPGTRSRYRPGLCFYNAQRLVAADTTDTLMYVEGVVARYGLVIVHHAWVILNGKVIDVTWPAAQPRRSGPLRNRIVGEFPAHTGYYGAEFTALEVVGSLVQKNAYEPLICDIGPTGAARTPLRSA